MTWLKFTVLVSAIKWAVAKWETLSADQQTKIQELIEGLIGKVIKRNE